MALAECRRPNVGAATVATDSSFAGYVCDQVAAAGKVVAKKMFGEYAVYLDGKVVALLCDNQCFVKPTAAGRALLARVAEGAPYPGAKPHFLVTEQLEDQELMQRLLRATAKELPAPKPKRQRR
jgi:TfoX/Sxy family transcriptional regulator of competence genes